MTDPSPRPLPLRRHLARLAAASGALLLAATLAPVSGAGATSKDASTTPPGVARTGFVGQPLDVMTQNLYLGASLAPALQAGSTAELVAAAAVIYEKAIASDFESRAAAVARTIDTEDPDLIGLQEVSRWTGLRVDGGPALPSPDFLVILMAELEKRGLDYEVASVSGNADIQLPLVNPARGCTSPQCFVSLLDRDVVLVNADTPGLEWSNPRDGNYVAQQTVRGISFNRGWASIDASYKGVPFLFVNTHLEVEGFAQTQIAQAAEFLALLPVTGRVIATGDFNSAADGTSTQTYGELTSVLTDAWTVKKGHKDGDTCCQDAELDNLRPDLGSRIDLVLTGGAVETVNTHVVGDRRFQALPPYWASDHLGVVATLRLR